MSGKILTAQKNVKKRLTAKLDRIFFIRSHIFHDTFVFNNLRYLYPLLTNKFIDSKVKQLSFLKASAKLNVYSTSVVLHY